MKLGTNDIGSVYLGTNAVQKVYLGVNEVWTSFTGLLDDYPNAAAAYSLRKLRSAYTGDAIRVRIDTTGNPEYNIGFVNNELDVATLEGYCTGGLNAYVKTWYDQSGNGNDATQTSAANQPQIVSSGSVILENGKPSVQFDGSDDALSVGNFDLYSNTNGQCIISVFKALNANTNRQIIAKYFAGQSKRQWNFANDNYNVQDLANSYNGSNLAQGVNTQTQQLFFGNWIPSTSTILYQNSTNSYTATTSATDISTTDAPVLIGRSGDTNSQLNANIQEIIVFDFSQSSNRTGIETNINDFYSIY